MDLKQTLQVVSPFGGSREHLIPIFFPHQTKLLARRRIVAHKNYSSLKQFLIERSVPSAPAILTAKKNIRINLTARTRQHPLQSAALCFHYIDRMCAPNMHGCLGYTEANAIRHTCATVCAQNQPNK